MLPGSPLDVSTWRPAWMRLATCRHEDTATFFSKSVKRAKELCSVCPVRAECLAFAMADPEMVGVFGGTTEREREAMRN